MNFNECNISNALWKYYESFDDSMKYLWENTMKMLWISYAMYIWLYMCVCVCVCCVCARVYVCMHTYNHIKISYTEICTDKNYIYITKFRRYILLYHINMVPVITLMKLSLYKDFIVWILYKSYIIWNL